MTFEEAKNNFIHQWGVLGSSWGINKTEAMIHALLMISPEPLGVEEIMKELNISRGNVSMSLRSLMDWGVVHKQFVTNERRDFFKSEKDPWALSMQVAKERNRRELQPVLKVLAEVQKFDQSKKKNKDEQEFLQMTSKLQKLARKFDNLLERATKSEQNWFWNNILKLFK